MIAVKNRPSLLVPNHGVVVHRIEDRIPKQVRDDNVRDFQKVMMVMTAFADSESVIIRHLNSFQHPGRLSENITSSHSELVSESRLCSFVECQ